MAVDSNGNQIDADRERQVREKLAAAGVGQSIIDQEAGNLSRYDDLDAAVGGVADRYRERASSGGGGAQQGGQVAGTTSGGGGSTPQSSPTSAWSQRADDFYGQLMGRINTGVNVNANDPIIKGQTDAYRVQQTRASRSFLDDLAEKGGANANLLGEQRLASERVGENVSGFEAQLMGRDVQAQRDEIAQALQMGAGMLSDQQRMDLQQRLAEMDNALRARGLDQQNDQFLRELAMREWQMYDDSDYRWRTDV